MRPEFVLEKSPVCISLVQFNNKANSFSLLEKLLLELVLLQSASNMIFFNAWLNSDMHQSPDLISSV